MPWFTFTRLFTCVITHYTIHIKFINILLVRSSPAKAGSAEQVEQPLPLNNRVNIFLYFLRKSFVAHLQYGYCMFNNVHILTIAIIVFMASYVRTLYLYYHPQSLNHLGSLHKIPFCLYFLLYSLINQIFWDSKAPTNKSK